MAHTCHATNCKKPVAEEMFMCKKHWYQLPAFLRNQIWKHYVKGQEITKTPTREYCLSAIECVKYIARLERIEPDIRLYEIYMPEEK